MNEPDVFAERDDWELLSMAYARDAESDRAYRELCRRYYDKVCYFCGHTIRDVHRVEDVAQEVFMRLYKRDFPKEGHAKFESLLFAIARNAVSEFLPKPSATHLRKTMRGDRNIRFHETGVDEWTLTEAGLAEVDAIRHAFAHAITSKMPQTTRNMPRRSFVGAAILVLADAKGPMSSKDIVEKIKEIGLYQPRDGKGPRRLGEAEVSTLVAPSECQTRDRFYERACEELAESVNLREKRSRDYLAFHLAVYRRRRANVEPIQRSRVRKEGRVFAAPPVFRRYLWLRWWSGSELHD